MSGPWERYGSPASGPWDQFASGDGTPQRRGRPGRRGGGGATPQKAAFYETELGPAEETSPGWLRGDGFAKPIAAFEDLKPVYPTTSRSVPRLGEPVISSRPRTLGERFTSALEDQAQRGPMISGARAAMPKGRFQNNPADDFDQPSLGTQVVGQERERRERYDLMTGADPWFRAPGGVPGKAAAGVATAAGSVAGTFTDPSQIFVSAFTGGQNLWGQVLTQAGINAGTDIAAQGADLASGTQDRYSPEQTAVSAALGAVIPAGAEAVRRGIKTAFPKGGRPVMTRDAGVPTAYIGWEPPEAAPRPNRAAPGAGRPADQTLTPTLDEPGARAVIKEAFPDAVITSGKRTPERNAQVGGADTSWHLSGEALDFVPPKGMTLAGFRSFLEGKGLPIRELFDEGDHFHWAWGRGGPNQSASAPGMADDAARAASEPSGRGPTFEEPPLGEVIDIASRTGRADGGRGGARGGFADEGPPFGGAVQPPKATRVPSPKADTFDPTDAAIELIRSGKPAKFDQGPSLIDFMSRSGGVNDVGGELRAADLDMWHRSRPFAPRVIRDDGLSLGDMAQRAYDAGFFRDVAPPRMEGGDSVHPVTPQRFIDAIRQEMAGKPRFARDPDPVALDVQSRAGDLKEILDHLGLDPRMHSTPDLRKAVDEFFRQPDARFAMKAPPSARGRRGVAARRQAAQDAPSASAPMAPTAKVRPIETEGVNLADGPAQQGLIPGVEPISPVQRSIAAELRQRQAQRGSDAPEAGGLFDASAPPVRDQFSGDAYEARGIELRARLAERHTTGDLFDTPTPSAPPPLLRARSDADSPLRPVQVGSDEFSPPSIAQGPTVPPGAGVPQGFGPSQGMSPPQALRGPTAIPTKPAAGPPTALWATGKQVPRLRAEGAEPATLPSAQIGGLREAPRPGAVPRLDDPSKGKRIPQGMADLAGGTVSDLARRVRVALDIPVRQGRIAGGRKTLGEYNTKTGVARLRAVQEMDVLAHEATHALEFKRLPSLDAALKAHDGNLRKLAYPGADPSAMREEGFAEFGRWYLTNPDHARRVGGQFYDAFEQALGRDNPQLLSDLRGIQQAYQQVLSSASLDVAAASIKRTGFDTPIKGALRQMAERGPMRATQDLLDSAYRSLFDRLHPINVAVRKLQEVHARNHGQRLDLKAANNPYSLARIAVDAYGSAHADAMFGVRPFNGIDPEGPAFSDVLKTAFGDRWGSYPEEQLAQLDAYLVARRMVHEWKRYNAGDLQAPPDRNTPEFHQQVIEDAEALHPTWKDAAAQLYDYQNRLWQKEFDAGFITKSQYENGLNGHPDYVPLYRDVSDKGGPVPRRARGAMQYAGGVKEFRGSTRDVISPMTSILRRTFELNANIHRNEVVKALAKLGDAAGRGSGEVVERLPRHEAELVAVDAMEALRRAAEDAGVPERDLTSLLTATDALLDGQTQTTLFRQRELSPRKGEPVLFMWENGHKTPLLLADGKFGQEMFEAVSSMTPDTRNIFLDTVTAGAQALRLGVTAAPEFVQKAVIRDWLAAWINTDTGVLPPALSSMRGMAQELGGSPFARRYEAAGGLKGGANAAAWRTPIPRNDMEAGRNLQRMNPTGRAVRRFANWKGFAELTDVSDTGTRLGIAKITFDRARARGLNEREAMVEAVMEARDFFDPTRIGGAPGMMIAARTVPFLNSSLQGLDKAVRVLSGVARAGKTGMDQRARVTAYKAWAKISALAAISVTLRALYEGNQEYQEFNDYTRATNWLFKINGKWFAIPKPYELAFPANLGERFYEAAVEKDPRVPDRILHDVMNTLAPPHEATAISVPMQIARNRDDRRVPIVPDHLRGKVDPRLQFSRYTSETAKMIGNALRVSPSVVQHVITGFGGTWGRYALQGGDAAIGAARGQAPMANDLEDTFGTRGFVRRPSRGSDSEENYWRLAGEEGDFTVAARTFKALSAEGKDDAALQYLAKLDPAQREFVLASTFLRSPYSGAHPLLRAQKSAKTISDLRAENREGALVSVEGSPISLSPKARREVDSALDDLLTVELRNAQVAAGVRGWEQREPMDRQAVLERLRSISPEAAAALQSRWRSDKVIPPEQAARAWGAVAPRLEALDEEALRGLMLRDRTDTRDGKLDEWRRRALAR